MKIQILQLNRIVIGCLVTSQQLCNTATNLGYWKHVRINHVTSTLLFTWKSKQKAPIILLINNKRMHHLLIIELRVFNAIKLIISRQSL